MARLRERLRDRRRPRVGRNDPCLCGTGKRFKRCCEGRVDWHRVLQEEPASLPKYLTARGKNRLFLETIASALQLDRSAPTRWPDVKAAITPDSVREIHEAVLWLWPDLDDLGRVLDLESTESSGLYVPQRQGSFRPTRGLLRSRKRSRSRATIRPSRSLRLWSR